MDKMARVHTLIRPFIILIGISFISWILLGVQNSLETVKQQQKQCNENLLRFSLSMPLILVENNEERKERVQPKVETVNRVAALSERLLENEKKYSSEREQYITTRMHGIVGGGGLGNQLFELLSCIGIAKSMNAKPYLSASDQVLMRLMTSSILPRFPKLAEHFEYKMLRPELETKVPFHGQGCCRYQNISELYKYSARPFIRLEGAYFQSYKYFASIRPLVRSLVEPSPQLAQFVENLLSEKIKDHFKICVHVRRGDFVTDGMHLPSDGQFTYDVAQLLARKYKTPSRKVAVIALGNDPIWNEYLFTGHSLMGDHWQNVLGMPSFNNRAVFNIKRSNNLDYEFILMPTLAAEVDLAFSRKHCDAVVITAPSSTYGFWLSYLAKDGAIVYYRDITQTRDKVMRELNPKDFFPPEWIKLQTTFDGTIYQAADAPPF